MRKYDTIYDNKYIGLISSASLPSSVYDCYRLTTLIKDIGCKNKVFT